MKRKKHNKSINQRKIKKKNLNENENNIRKNKLRVFTRK